MIVHQHLWVATVLDSMLWTTQSTLSVRKCRSELSDLCTVKVYFKCIHYYIVNLMSSSRHMQNTLSSIIQVLMPNKTHIHWRWSKGYEMHMSFAFNSWHPKKLTLVYNIEYKNFTCIACTFHAMK